MISAPKSASCRLTILPETRRDRSTTQTPSSGQAASGSKDLRGRLIGRTSSCGSPTLSPRGRQRKAARRCGVRPLLQRRRQIGAGKIIADEEQRLAPLAGQRIGEAVAEI